MVVWRALSFVVLGIAGMDCMPPAASPAVPPEKMSLSVPGDLREVQWEGSRIFGPSIEIVRGDDTYRGQVFNAVVDLRTDDAMIQGTRGGRTELRLEPERDGFSIHGMNAGKLGSLDVRADRIVGQLGGCQYDLRDPEAGGSRYHGARVCSHLDVSSRWPLTHHYEPAELSLTPAVAALPAKDRAALFAILLGP